ncbi:radical SAM family heme chaperone HemW [Prolixibacter sp. NT017]|uniref:radical SAM family heme chaperone HemW n=1 Tax=Prolixibacter sp. NT017 TaxID=2652390 RepID=UPI001298FC27|nr:radical SAM family heme chaperone HemW [Prolixibacter sp. NT017]
MAGIYFHIPFCKTHCHYCDFHTSCRLADLPGVMKAEFRELSLRKNYLGDEVVDTIYLGGGTPSLLGLDYLKKIQESVHSLFKVNNEAEWTIEANPDDLEQKYLYDLQKSGFNRLSIGTQSFDEEILKYLNRRHNAQQSVRSVLLAREAGFQNISADLIYGIPGLSKEAWERSVDTVVNLDVEHVSAYHLTYHEGTVLYQRLQDGKLSEVPDEVSLEQYEYLVSALKNAGYEHYEVSNFAKPGYYSRHNSAYWKEKKYLGIGPSAHSYDGLSRQWNIRSNPQYVQLVNDNQKFFDIEELSEVDRYNDYIITSLRTIWGIDIRKIETEWNSELGRHFHKSLAKYCGTDLVFVEDDILRLTEKGIFVSDRIMEDFFYA